MDMKTINFIKKNYSKRTNELGKSLNATNSVLENFLEDLNKETAKLQSNKEFGKVIDVINTQQTQKTSCNFNKWWLYRNLNLERNAS